MQISHVIDEESKKSSKLLQVLLEARGESKRPLPGFAFSKQQAYQYLFLFSFAF